MMSDLVKLVELLLDGVEERRAARAEQRGYQTPSVSEFENLYEDPNFLAEECQMSRGTMSPPSPPSAVFDRISQDRTGVMSEYSYASHVEPVGRRGVRS